MHRNEQISLSFNCPEMQVLTFWGITSLSSVCVCTCILYSENGIILFLLCYCCWQVDHSTLCVSSRNKSLLDLGSRWATSWLVPSASRGSEFHRATRSPGVGEARRCPYHGLRGPCVPTHLSLSSCWSLSSGNGMCFSICLTLLVKDLSPSFPLPVPVSPCPLSLSPCLCLSVSVSLCPLWFYIDLLFLLHFSLVIAWTQLFSPPSIVPYFLLVSIVL